jgi:hypothetical protein
VQKSVLQSVPAKAQQVPAKVLQSVPAKPICATP